jgi:hypothetical protein
MYLAAHDAAVARTRSFAVCTYGSPGRCPGAPCRSTPGIRLVAGGVVQGCVGARGELDAGRQAAVPVRLLRLQPGYT